VLILDDLGAESRTEWVSEQMHILLDLRSRQGRPTMITSNVPLGQMGQRDASRIADLPAGHVLVYVGGHDQRTGTPAGDGLVYHQLGGRPLICAMCHSRPCLPTCKKHMFGPPPEEA
jgi:hypothetical protein